ncbi:hypothetical protein FRB94_000548 [Tulasnella sp. JGI-2019a]|nr:hypothetical protein FRB94_000548 [Tulasnella sp. JGI-2019a]KAG9016142.1 hypothetical protein FRB93_011616 [Tulasnella sp. JGI-2019a]
MARTSNSMLGAESHYNPPATSRIIPITPSTCTNLSLFKDLMKEYRKLDDSVTMRLNRSNAQFRDRDRLGLGTKGGNPQDESCLYFWKELVANWKDRTQIVNYCVDVVDKSMDERRKLIEGTDPALDAEPQVRAKLYSEEVLRNQIHNELSVEQIIRQQSLEAFKSRCKFFEPPLADAEARQWWWEGVHKGR